MSRDRSIDILRGFAIFAMAGANAAPYALLEPHPFWFRCWGSFAAPLFITIAGYLVAETATRHARPFSYFLLRGVMTILVGVLLDVLVWRILPFLTADILYLIGLSLPLGYLASRLPRWTQACLVLGIFLLAPLLRFHFGYAAAPYEVSLSEGKSWMDFSRTAILRQWFLDGWFPLLPWLGFALLGIGLKPLRTSRRYLPVSLVFLAMGIPLFARFHGPIYIREGYSELFYPPSSAYLVLALGMIGIFLKLSELASASRWSKPFEWMGQCSLAVYILHLVLIQFGIVPWLPKQDLQGFAVVYLALSAILVVFAYGIHRLKEAWPQRPWLVQFLLGG